MPHYCVWLTEVGLTFAVSGQERMGWIDYEIHSVYKLKSNQPYQRGTACLDSKLVLVQESK